MKKIILVCLLLIALVACQSQKTDPEPTVSDPIENEEPAVQKEEIEYEPFEKPEKHIHDEPSALNVKVSTSSNYNDVEILVKNGKIVFTSKDGEDLGDMTGLSGVKGIAKTFDCGGSIFLVALLDNGQAVTFDLGIEMKEEGASFVYDVSNLKTIEFGEDIVDIGVYRDESPLNRCKFQEFYYVLQSGKVVNEEGVERSVAYPFYSYFELDGGYVVLFYNDNTVYRGIISYENWEFLNLEQLKYEGKAIEAVKESCFELDGVLYLVDSNNNLYVYDLDDDSYLKYTNAEVKMYKAKGDENRVYPSKVEIKTDEKTFVLEGDVEANI